jgi:putative transposase
VDEEKQTKPKAKKVRVTREMDRATQLIDELLKDYKTPEQILGANGLMGELTRRLVERATSGELTTHLGCEKGDPAGRNSGNSRNGTHGKMVQTDQVY